MPDYRATRIEEIDAVHGGTFRRARAALGVTSFGLQILELPPNREGTEHDHSRSGQEEVYIVLRGSGEIEVDGKREKLDTETLIRVGPLARRQIRAGSAGMRVLALGAIPGEPYEAPRNTELDAPDLIEKLPHARLMELLEDPACPVVQTADGERVVPLDGFEQFVGQREAPYETLDERLDQFLTYLGAKPVTLPDGQVGFRLPS